jgi:hypothetical protein
LLALIGESKESWGYLCSMGRLGKNLEGDRQTLDLKARVPLGP